MNLENNDIKILRENYYQAIQKLNNENDIISSLPTTEFTSFFEIMSGLIELLNKDIKKVKNELITEKDDLEICVILKEDLKNLLFKKSICDSLILEAKQITEMENNATLCPKKNIIFATTKAGNIYIEKDLKNIPEEYYDEIKELFVQLEEGLKIENNQKGRSIQNNSKLSKIFEKKAFKIRIFYRNLSEDTVFVLLARLKKGDNDLLDRDEAITRNEHTSNQYKKLKQDLLDPLKKQKIIQENIAIRDDILNYIKEKRRG